MCYVTIKQFPVLCCHQVIKEGTLLFNLPVVLDFSLTVKAATLIFISGCGSAILYAKEG